MSGRLVDFHCHLDLYPDHAAAVAQCERDKVWTLAVTTTPRAWSRNQELAVATRYVRAALGLHPQLVAERADELSLWERHLRDARYVGEVGLDAGPRYRGSLGLQKRVFERILCACAEHGGKILSVHSVRSAGVVLDMIESLLPSPRGRVILHWFSGSRSDARRAVQLGCFFSINWEMLQRDRSRALVRSLPADRILTETDGPFTRIGNRPRRPADVGGTVEALADLREEEPADTARRIWNNVSTLLDQATSSPL